MQQQQQQQQPSFDPAPPEPTKFPRIFTPTSAAIRDREHEHRERERLSTAHSEAESVASYRSSTTIDGGNYGQHHSSRISPPSTAGLTGPAVPAHPPAAASKSAKLAELSAAW